MTKQNWFLEFRRILSILPETERIKAEEYYKELYEDKSDAGLSETEILNSFGTPYQAASEVIEEYSKEDPFFTSSGYDENTGYAKGNNLSTTQLNQERKDKSDNKVLWTVICILCFFPVLGIYLTMFGISIGLIAIPVALSASAIGLPLTYIALVPTMGSIFSWIGGSLILFSLAIVFAILAFYAVKWMFKGMGMLIGMLKKAVLEM